MVELYMICYMEIWIYIALVFVVYAKRSGMDCITIGRIPPTPLLISWGTRLEQEEKEVKNCISNDNLISEATTAQLTDCYDRPPAISDCAYIAKLS